MTSLPEEDDAVRIPLDGCLDLHAFSPRDIPSVVEEYLLACLREGVLEVRIIHGKGTGFQRRVVTRLLDRLPCVASHRGAPPEAGSWGATMVRLKPTGNS
jgi:DNA-nicking Smr family endonuclease